METLKKIFRGIFSAICAFFIRLGKALCKGLMAFWDELTEKAENENKE